MIGAGKALELGVEHHFAQLPRAIAAKIEEKNAVALGDERPRFLYADQRGHELVGFLDAVFAMHGGDRIIGVGAFAEED